MLVVMFRLLVKMHVDAIDGVNAQWTHTNNKSQEEAKGNTKGAQH